MQRERGRQLRHLIKVVIGCALAAGSSALTTARAQVDDIATYPHRTKESCKHRLSFIHEW